MSNWHCLLLLLHVTVSLQSARFCLAGTKAIERAFGLYPAKFPGQRATRVLSPIIALEITEANSVRPLPSLSLLLHTPFLPYSVPIATLRLDISHNRALFPPIVDHTVNSWRGSHTRVAFFFFFCSLSNDAYGPYSDVVYCHVVVAAGVSAVGAATRCRCQTPGCLGGSPLHSPISSFQVFIILFASPPPLSLGYPPTSSIAPPRSGLESSPPLSSFPLASSLDSPLPLRHLASPTTTSCSPLPR